MKKFTIIYYSNSGHVEAMADQISKGAEANGAQVKIMRINEARVNEVLDSDIVAFGCPSMDGNDIESLEMKPFIAEFKLIPVENKKCILFGSYGWDDGEFMEKWARTMTEYEFDIVRKYTVKESPTPSQLKECYEIGSQYSK